MSEPTGWSAPGGDGPPPAGPAPYGPPPSGPPSYGPPPSYGTPPSGPPVAGELPPPVIPSWFAPPAVAGLGVAVLGVSALYVVTKVAECFLVFSAETQYETGGTGSALALYGGVSIVESLVAVVAWVVSSVWLMRLYRAAKAASPDMMRRKVAWTWLGWWVPIVSFWFPKQIVDDVWRVAGAQPGRTGAGQTGRWWGLWIATVLSDRVASRAFGNGGGGSGFVVVSAVCAVVGFVFWYRVVRGLSAAHDAGPWTPNAPVPARPSSGTGYGTN